MLYIVTVHGTGDGEMRDSTTEIAWWYWGSAFSQILKKNFEAFGMEKPRDYDWIEFKWSGKNSETDRMNEGKRLAAVIDGLRRGCQETAEFLVIAHSHGGNVAIDAAVELSLKGQARTRDGERLKDVHLIFVGTPFFDYKSQSMIPAAVRQMWNAGVQIALWHPVLWFGALLVAVWARFKGGTALARLVLCTDKISCFSKEKGPHWYQRAFDALTHDLGGGAAAAAAPWIIVSAAVIGILAYLVWRWGIHVRANERVRALEAMGRTIPASDSTDGDETLAGDKITEGMRFIDTRPAGIPAGGTGKPMAESGKSGAGDSYFRQIKSLGEVLKGATVIGQEKDEAVLALREIADMKTSIPLTEPAQVKGVARLILLALVVPTAVILKWTYHFSSAFIYLWVCVALLSVIAVTELFWDKMLSSWLNAAFGTLVRKSALGDDQPTRYVARVTPNLPLPASARHMWSYLPQEFVEAHSRFIGASESEAWRRAKEFLVLAQFSGKRKMAHAIEQSGAATWNALYHTTYFRCWIVTHFIAYTAIRASTTVMEKVRRRGPVETFQMNTFEDDVFRPDATEFPASPAPAATTPSIRDFHGLYNRMSPVRPDNGKA